MKYYDTDLKYPLDEDKYYLTIDNYVVKIIAIRDDLWGIGGEWITGGKTGVVDNWDDAEYPYLYSYDTDEVGYGLTNREVNPMDDPQYFL